MTFLIPCPPLVPLTSPTSAQTECVSCSSHGSNSEVHPHSLQFCLARVNLLVVTGRLCLRWPYQMPFNRTPPFRQLNRWVHITSALFTAQGHEKIASTRNPSAPTWFPHSHHHDFFHSLDPRVCDCVYVLLPSYTTLETSPSVL